MDLPPIIITGCPRSGTQMMARVFGRLSSDFFLITEHSDKRTDVPEEQTAVEDHRLWWECFEYRGWDRARQRPSVDIPIFDDAAAEKLREKYLQLAEGRQIVIKNPSHILYPELVRKVFPTAKFVYCVRNPWHVLQSMVKQDRESFLLRSPRAADVRKSLLLRAAIGWGDAYASFRQHHDSGWAIAKYEQFTDAPHAAIANLCDALGLGGQEQLDIDLAAAVPRPSRSNFYFIKHAFSHSPERESIQNEVRAGCEVFDYPITPAGLSGSQASYVAELLAARVRRSARKLWRRAA